MLQCYNVAKLQNQYLHSSMHKNLTALILLFRIFFVTLRQKYYEWQ